ncbi:MAG: M20 family peptidase [Oceanicoccus sp.]
MNILIKVVFLALIVLVAVIGFNTMNYQSPSVIDAEVSTIVVDMDRVVVNMQKAVGYRTISFEQGTVADGEQFTQFITFLEDSYPAVHRHTQRTIISDYSLLFKWQGKNPSLQPVLLTGHYDVVPVIPGTEDKWESAPFSGELKDGYIYGRGAMDDKSAVISMMEAAEALLSQGFQPQRTVYFSFGHDEEVSGLSGAGEIARQLKDEGIQFAWSLDEGSFVLDGLLPVDKPVAMINVAEKGYVSIEIIATGVGGHSSMPPKKTAVGKLAEAIVKIQQSPFPGGLTGISGEMMDQLGPYLPLSQRIFMSNRWLFGRVVEDGLSSSPAMNASMRTTIAPTMLSASPKENVLPIEAKARINLRLHPRDTPESVEQHFNEVLEGFEDVSVKLRHGSNASPVASASSAGFQTLSASVRQVFGDVIVVPGITVAATDSRHYVAVSDNAYRFNPMQVGSEDLSGFHGTNERVSLENLGKAVQFYQSVISSQ